MSTLLNYTAYTELSPRVLANQCATESKKARDMAMGAQKHKEAIAAFLKSIKSLSFILYFYTLLYLVLLAFDLAYMSPMLKSVVMNGFLLDSNFYLYFVILYGVMALLLTSIFSYGFAYRINSKLLTFDIMEEKINGKINHTRPVDFFRQLFSKDEKGHHRASLGAGILFIAIAMSVALFRNWIINGYQIQLSSIADLINLLLPLTFVLLLLYLGPYKLYLARLIFYQYNKSRLEKEQSRQSEIQTEYKFLALAHEGIAISEETDSIIKLGRNEDLESLLKEENFHPNNSVSDYT